MKKLIFILIALLLAQCVPFRGSGSKLPKENLKIAVLPFTARGPAVSQRTGHIAADKLTTLLFMEKKMPVVDRSQVNYILHERQIENVYFLSGEDLAEIADTLKASVIVLGLIENRTKQKEFETPENTLAITLRFLDGKTGEILEMANGTKKDKKPPEEMIETILSELIANIK